MTKEELLKRAERREAIQKEMSQIKKEDTNIKNELSRFFPVIGNIIENNSDE